MNLPIRGLVTRRLDFLPRRRRCRGWFSMFGLLNGNVIQIPNPIQVSTQKPNQIVLRLMIAQMEFLIGHSDQGVQLQKQVGNLHWSLRHFSQGLPDRFDKGFHFDLQVGNFVT